MRIRVRHEHVVDLVVDAARRAQTHHVPVVDQLHLLDRQHEDPRLAGALDDPERVNVRAVLDARREAPRTAQPESAFVGNGVTGTRALARDHGQTLAGEQLLDRRIAEIRGAGADRERRGHQHPTGRRIAVGDVLDDLERAHGVELGAADRLRHPHAEEALAVQRLDDGLGELAVLVSIIGVLASERTDALRTLR